MKSTYRPTANPRSRSHRNRKIGVGPKQGEELNKSRFVKDWAKSAGQSNVGAFVLDYEGPVRPQVIGKHVELLDLPRGQEGLPQHMQDGEYDSRIELRERNRGSLR